MLLAPLPRRRALLTLVLPVLSVPQARAQQAPLVVASFSILGDMLRQVAGEAVRLRVIAGPEADAHHFQARPSDAAALREAALVLRNGLGFEPWLDRLLPAAGSRARVETVSEGIAARPGDPHAWQDLRLAQHYARRVGAALAGVLPGQAAALEAGAAAYAARLGALDGWVRAQFATVPEDRRIAVTQHDAFGYLGAAYGVRFLSPQTGGSAEPAARRVAALIDRIRTERITALFADGPHSPAVLQRIARESGQRLRGRLYADTLSRPDGPAPTYEAMMRHNVTLLVAAMRA